HTNIFKRSCWEPFIVRLEEQLLHAAEVPLNIAVRSSTGALEPYVSSQFQEIRMRDRDAIPGDFAYDLLSLFALDLPLRLIRDTGWTAQPSMSRPSASDLIRL
ncbi:hypothetical protein FRB98_004109, partial [Tulasnella sp. 332]